MTCRSSTRTTATWTSPASPPGDCVFGDPAGDVTVVLFGDSHAAQWFPALERLATERGWRLVSMTKSACTTADIDIWADIVKRRYEECTRWREAALGRMAAERPDLVVVSDSRGYKAMVDGSAVPIATVRDQWDAAAGRTLERLADLAGHVVVIGDTPRARRIRQSACPRTSTTPRPARSRSPAR